MAQQAIAGPLRESHLRDEIGLHPVRPLQRLEPVRERAFRHVPRSKEPGQPIQLRLVEAGADRSRPSQRSVIVVVADEQRAEVLPRLPRLGPAADDELLLLDEFELAPRRRCVVPL